MRFIYSKEDINGKKIGCIEVLSEEEAREYLCDIFSDLPRYDGKCLMWEVYEENAKHMGNDYLADAAKNNLKKTIDDFCYKHSIYFL